MRDYVLNDKGDVKEVWFQNINNLMEEKYVNTPQIRTKSF